MCPPSGDEGISRAAKLRLQAGHQIVMEILPKLVDFVPVGFSHGRNLGLNGVPKLKNAIVWVAE